jgi:hypothetical protein
MVNGGLSKSVQSTAILRRVLEEQNENGLGCDGPSEFLQNGQNRTNLK